MCYKLIIFTCINYLFLSCSDETRIKQLKVDNTFLTDVAGKSIILRGVTFGWSNEDFKFYNKHTVKWLKDDWNVSVVRATLGIEPSGGYLEQPEEQKKYIFQVIDGALENDLYVVVAWHCNNIHETESKAFFKELAHKYGRYPNIIYEVFTEPDNESWNELKPFYTEMIKVIREEDPDNIILLSAPFYSQQVKTVADDPLLGFSNIMYTVHFCSGNSGQSLRDDCNYALKNNIPIIVSDHLLTDCSCNSELFVNEWHHWLDWFDRNQISWIVWSISDKKESCSLLKPGANPEGKWSINDINPSGEVVRSMLLNINQPSLVQNVNK